MNRHPVLSTVAFVLALAVILAAARPLPGIAHQVATPDTGDEHPIVGAWQWINNPDTPSANPSYAVFNAGGTYVELDTPIGVGIGAWQPTGARTADLTIVFQDIDTDPNTLTPGTSTYRIAAEVDATGNAIAATGDLTVRDASGTVIETVPFTGTAARVVAEAPGTTGSPVATTAGGEWWTAWSTCDVTPVRFGSPPGNIPGMSDNSYWLAAETVNDSDIDLVVWLWTGNRPLPLDGQYAGDGTSTKWLWAFSEPMQDITATVTNERGTEGMVDFAGEILGSSTGPINGWPSGVVLPEPGCWTFDITATALDGAVYEGRIVFPAVP